MENKLTDTQINCINFLKQGKTALDTIYGKPEEDNCKKVLSALPKYKEDFSGDFVCLYCGFEKSRFDENEQVFCLYLFNEADCKGDWYRMSLSMSFNTKTNQMPIEKTFETLRKVIDIQGNTIDWNYVISQLAGKTIPAWVTEKETSKGTKYFAIVSIGSNFDIPKPLPIPQNIDLGKILQGQQITNADIPFTPATPAAFPPAPSAFPQAQPTAPATKPANPFASLK